jgi:hypothetical protein
MYGRPRRGGTPRVTSAPAAVDRTGPRVDIDVSSAAGDDPAARQTHDTHLKGAADAARPHGLTLGGVMPRCDVDLVLGPAAEGAAIHDLVLSALGHLIPACPQQTRRSRLNF